MRKAFLNKLYEFADDDRDVMLLTGDLGFSVFEGFRERFSKQFLNVGLSEQSMIGMAAGLALEGKKVFVYSIIPFLIYRTFEQIRNDLCYQQVPVKLIGVGSGILYGPQGPTHHAIEDIGIMTSLPEMMVFAPGDPLEVEAIMKVTLQLKAPCYIRLNRNGDPMIHTPESIRSFQIGVPLKVSGSSPGICICAMGNVLPLGRDVYHALEQKGQNVALYSFPTIKPLKEEAIKELLLKNKLLLILEEHVAYNGLSSIFYSIKAKFQLDAKILSFSLPNEFIKKIGTQKYLQKEYHLSTEDILQAIKPFVDG